MYPLIRPATQAEIDTIKDKSDLTLASAVIAMGDTDPILGVVRICAELDPVFFPDNTSDQKKHIFLWGVFSKLTGMYPEVYFNVHADDVKTRTALEKLGCETTSTAPEFRYKKALR